MTTEERLTDLEVRLTHYEQAIDGLTRANLTQQQAIELLQTQLDQIRVHLQQAASTVGGSAADEPPPPHY